MSSPVSRLARLGLLTAAALVLSLVEASLPRPLPWMRLGLANAAVLVALLLLGAGPALAVSLVKVVLGGLLGGGFGGPAFVIGGAAGLASLATMVLLRCLAPTHLSPVGLSIAGAAAHQVTQLLVASGYLGHPGLLALLPLSLTGGVVSGLLTGLAAYFALERLRRFTAVTS
jgi:heptaprenyl diphosphate synthase